VPLDIVFDSFQTEPLAAASSGQVHRAILRGTGEPAADKVQRPGIEDLVSFTSHCADGDAHDLDLAERVPTSSPSSHAR
jgi:hypothetical protein